MHTTSIPSFGEVKIGHVKTSAFLFSAAIKPERLEHVCEFEFMAGNNHTTWAVSKMILKHLWINHNRLIKTEEKN